MLTKGTDAWPFCHSPEGVPCHLKLITVGCFPWLRGQRSGKYPRRSHAVPCISKKNRVPHSASTAKPSSVSFTLSESFPVLYKCGTAPNPASYLCPREIHPLAISSPRVSACALCCNIATYRRFQFEFISCNMVWTAYNHNVVILSYRHHRQKFRLELSSQFSPNLVKLIFFYLLVWQESALIAKVQKFLELRLLNIHSRDTSERSDFLDQESCEALLFEFGDDSRSSSSKLP